MLLSAVAAGAAPAADTAGSYRNPVLPADYSDPDVVRVGGDYYLVASSFQAVPGLPILHSRDLVNWTLVGHAAPRLHRDFDWPQHGGGLWAPSMRHHDGWFWIFVADPDRGVYMTRARDARGPWEPLALVAPGRGRIDPCPFWDDGGALYLVHAWAKSRAGFNGVLTLARLSADGRRMLDAGSTIFEGGERHPTIEGSKLYKRNGWYYVFAPAGGVRNGWQVALRSRRIEGPYEDRVVLEQGATLINGPHQGGWVETPAGESWFVHFQDRGPYGRVVHLQPMAWVNDWPVIGEDRDGDGTGEPVLVWPRPRIAPSEPQHAPLAGDEFDGPRLALQWQWHGNPAAGSWSLRARRGHLRLSARPAEEAGNLWSATHLVLQKLPATPMTATARIDARGLAPGARAGLIVMGTDYAVLEVVRTAGGWRLRRATRRGADRGGEEVEEENVAAGAFPLDLRVEVGGDALGRFSSSADGRTFVARGGAFAAQPGRWIGAKVGIFALAPARSVAGHADFDYFRLEPAPLAPEGLVVAQDGRGDFRTIQAAIDAIPPDNTANRTILVRKGVYREKVFIRPAHISIVGDDREAARIEYSELRRNWRAEHPDDWGAAVVNIGPQASDVVLANLTVVNDYGRTHGGEDDHQFAIRSMGESTRIALLHVSAAADGGDTVSLWNGAGHTYYADSSFEGHVDYLCPRGWAYVTGCRFFGRSLTASLWHDGSRDPGQKLVVRNSRFDGVPGFALGRHHRDAQFYLLDSEFSARMADRRIYAAPAPDPLKWGTRVYVAGARHDGEGLRWLADSLHEAPGTPRDEDVTPAWTFGGRWRPETLPSVLPFAAIPGPENGWKWADPAGVTLRWTAGRAARAHRVHFGVAADPELRAEQEGTSFDTGPLAPGETYHWRVDTVGPRGLVRGQDWSFRADPRAVRIVLAGDSTVTDAAGWGRGFKARVLETAAVINMARGGRSSKSYREEGHWAAALARRPTHVLLQFGHNDQAGKGLERETDLPAFRVNMERYVREARAAGAQPVLVTPLTRRRFAPGGRVASDLADRAEAARDVAAREAAPLVDLHARSIEALERMGAERANALGQPQAPNDRTHLGDAGSALFGAIVAEEMAGVVPEIRTHLRSGIPPAKELEMRVGTWMGAAVMASALAGAGPADAAEKPWSARMADSVIKRTPDPLMIDAIDKPRWEYTPGLVLKAILDVHRATGEERYWSYAKAYYDGMIAGDGTIRGGYVREDYNIDRINPGKPLFLLYERTKEERYRKAIETLRRQMREHPRTSEGGFWHKKRYPHQMWLDGLYMGAPFLAQYAAVFGEPALFDDVVKQFVLMEKHARDEKTGLLHHGWDESRKQKWADPVTGRSPSFWGRAMGWYAMGLVETLDFLPAGHPGRAQLIAILDRLAAAVTRVQDPRTGLWFQVVDQGGRGENYLEASVSSMLSFALLKAARLGYVDARYGEAGRRAYEGILRELVEVDKDGLVNIHRVCQVAGLGGDPERGERYRDGTYRYYVTEKIRSNDPKAVGPFIFASLEMERR